MRKTLILAAVLVGYGYPVLAEDDALPIMAMTYITHPDVAGPSSVRTEPLKVYYPTPRDLLLPHQPEPAPAKTTRKQTEKRLAAKPAAMVADVSFYSHMMEKMR